MRQTTLFSPLLQAQRSSRGSRQAPPLCLKKLPGWACLWAPRRAPGRSRRVLPFWLFDHIGGMNMLFAVLASGGTLAPVADRRPHTVCSVIERHNVELLPASPTFLNLMLMAGMPGRFALPSLEIVQYSSEVMPASTLRRFQAAYPRVRLQQTYGLSETGILPTRSRDSQSTWIRLAGPGMQARVREGLLELRMDTAMRGYLNAPDPFTPDGWFRTGDRVEAEGEYVRILGRDSDVINTGGEKVDPAEVENVLLMAEGVEDAAVRGEANAIAGQIIHAIVKIADSLESPAKFRKHLRKFCANYLPPHKMPQKITLTSEDLHGGRFKKARRDTVL